MATTYKSVISQAIGDFNDIQTALAGLGAKYKFDGSSTLTAIPAVSTKLIPTKDLDAIISEQLQLKASGKYTVSASGDDIDISKYQYIYVPSATKSNDTFSAGSFTTGINTSSSTISFLASKPEGTDGTDYFSVTSSGTGTANSAKHTINVSKGFIDTAIADSHSGTPSASSNTTKYIAKANVSLSSNQAFTPELAADKTVTITGAINLGLDISTTAPKSGYFAKVSSKAQSSKNVSATITEGYIPAGTYGSSSITLNKSSDYYLNIPTNSITGSVTELNAPSVSVSGTTTGISTSASSTNFYFTISATGTNGSVKGKATAGATTGIVAANSTNTSGATTITPSISGNGNKIYIKTGILSNTASSGIKYDEITAKTTTENTGPGQHISGKGAVIIPEQGALYLNEGYYSNIKISLGTLIPDDTSLPNAGDSHILSGYEAYDTNGKKLVGTIVNIDEKLSNTNIGFSLSGLTLTASASIPAGYTSGKSLSNNYTISSLNVAADKTLNSITLSAKGSGAVAGTLSSLTNNGVITELSGTSGVISKISGTHSITTLNGTLTIGLGSDSDTSATGSSPKITIANTTVVQDGKIITASVSKDTTNKKALWGTGWISSGSIAASDICSGNVSITQQSGQSVAGYSTASVRSAAYSRGNLTGTLSSESPADKGLAKTTTAASNYVYTRVTEAAGSLTTSGWIGNNPFATRYVDVKIPAATPGTITSGTPSATVGSATTFSNSTGAIATTGAKSGTISAVSVLSSAYKDTYIINGITAKTNDGTASIAADATGSSVDIYVESLYKRMLGQTYTAVSAD